MSEYAAFSIGSYIPKHGAKIEETGTDQGISYVNFPFVNGSLEVNTGFKFRNWRARCLISGASLAELVTERSKIRNLVGDEHILNTGGEVFPNVALVASSLFFGKIQSTVNGFLQEVEMDFKQLRDV